MKKPGHSEATFERIIFLTAFKTYKCSKNYICMELYRLSSFLFHFHKSPSFQLNEATI